jgi:hypothetical protein
MKRPGFIAGGYIGVLLAVMLWAGPAPSTLGDGFVCFPSSPPQSSSTVTAMARVSQMGDARPPRDPVPRFDHLYSSPDCPEGFGAAPAIGMRSPVGLTNDPQPKIVTLMTLTDPDWIVFGENIMVTVAGCGLWVFQKEGADFPTEFVGSQREGVTLTIDLKAANCTLPIGTITVNVEATAERLCELDGERTRCEATHRQTSRGVTSWKFTVLPLAGPSPSRPPLPPLRIESLTPASGPAGSIVSIRGSGFRTAGPNELSPPASQILFDGVPIEAQFIGTTELRFMVPSEATCGTHVVKVQNPRTFLFQGELMPTESNPALFEIDVHCTPILPPPPPVDTTRLLDFDTNNNGRLDDDEFIIVIDAWSAGQLDDALFLHAMDLWVLQALIASARVPHERGQLKRVTLAIHRNNHTAVFLITEQGVRFMRVEVFDAGGRRIFTAATLGRRIVWKMSTPEGGRLANGVYLYTVMVRTADGKTLKSDVQKVVVLH